MKQHFKILFITVLLISGNLHAAKDNDKIQSGIVFNRDFFQKFIQAPFLLRDEYLEEKLSNKFVSGRGKIKAAVKIKRFKKNYCIQVLDTDLPKLNITVSYHLYTSEKDIVSLASSNSFFEFSGQFIGATPLNSKRDSYIFDILLEKGALIID